MMIKLSEHGQRLSVLTGGLNMLGSPPLEPATLGALRRLPGALALCMPAS